MFGVNAAAENFMVEAGSQMSSIGTAMVRVIKIGLAMAGLVTLLMAIINVTKGERESAGKIAWWVVGIAIGYLFISLLQNKMTGA